MDIEIEHLVDFAGSRDDNDVDCNDEYDGGGYAEEETAKLSCWDV